MAETSLISSYEKGVHQKASGLRVLDVFLFAPMIIAVGVKTKKLNGFTRLVLIGMGVGTMLYNGKNLIEDIRNVK